jgi:hypothetical protein
MWGVRVTIVGRAREMSVKYRECVSVLLCWLSCMQIASFLRYILLSAVACMAQLYLSAHIINSTIFGKKVIEHKNVCFGFL